MGFRLQVTRGEWAAQITALRLQAYARFGADLRDPSALHYGPSDHRHLNLAAIQPAGESVTGHDELLSILRIEKFTSETPFQFSLQSNVKPLRYPTAVLARAATATHAESWNLNMTLRYVALKALVEANYAEVFGSFKRRSRRRDFLESLGYELSEENSAWDDFLKTSEPVLVARLDLRKNGETALSKLASSLPRLHEPETQTAVASLVREAVVFLKT